MSYPIGKGKLSALKLLDYDIKGLDTVLGETSVTMIQLKNIADKFFLRLHVQKKFSTMNTARAHMFCSRKRPPPLKKTATNRCQPEATCVACPSPIVTVEGS